MTPPPLSTDTPGILGSSIQLSLKVFPLKWVETITLNKIHFPKIYLFWSDSTSETSETFTLKKNFTAKQKYMGMIAKWLSWTSPKKFLGIFLSLLIKFFSEQLFSRTTYNDYFRLNIVRVSEKKKQTIPWRCSEKELFGKTLQRPLENSSNRVHGPKLKSFMFSIENIAF